MTYVIGNSVQNYAKGLSGCQIGADAGNAQAMATLGLLYENGEAVKQDYSRASDALS